VSRRNSDQEWDKYWEEEGSSSMSVRAYSVIASFYRNRLIGPRLKYELNNNFRRGCKLMHGGSGAGEVDNFVKDDFEIVALDMSGNALKKYSLRHPKSNTILGDITDLSKIEGKFDGIYNLGVMEHLTPEEIRLAIKEFSSILKPGGKVIFFWPPVFGTSVIFLHLIHFVLNKILRKDIVLHPEEPNKLSFKTSFKKYLIDSDFKIIKFKLSIRDFFTYLVVVLEKD
jgi:SAM-dependent methyltransferase